MTTYNELMKRIFDVNIYDQFDASGYKLELNDWQSKHPFFAEYIERYKPKLIVELGTWKGGSAVHMAEIIKKLNLQCPIICIDTWLGHWYWWAHKDTGSFSSKKSLWQEIDTKNGWPSVFYQFLANVVHTGNKDIIIPIPQTTTHGIAMLNNMNIRPDMIYVDADHDYEPVYRDIVDAYALLPSGGVMLGDDYYAEYPGVMKAVDQFTAEHKLKFQTYPPNKWALVKP